VKLKTERWSPSRLNLYVSDREMFFMENFCGYKQPGNAPMSLGNAVEDGVTVGLMEGASLEDCMQRAYATYDTKTALLQDTRCAEYRKKIPDMVRLALKELKEYGVPSHTQQEVTWHPEGLKYPIYGKLDYRWDSLGVLTDLKTTQAMPSAVKPSHARQVAFYASGAGDNVDARLTYVTPKKVTTYRLENMRAHLDALHKIALAAERFIALSDDKQFYIDMMAPNYESFYWGGPARQVGFEVWGF
jgi:hypothetical protein